MHIGLLYAVVAFVGLCIIGIILNRTRATKYKETVDQPFCILLVFFLFFCLVDGIWGIFFANEGVEGTRLGYAIFTYGFHYMAGFSAFVWAGYLIRYTQIQKPWRMGLHIIRGGLLTSQLIVLTSNIWTGEAFTFTAAGAYQPGPIRSVLFWLQFTYYIILTVVGLLCLVLDKDPKARVRYRTALIFAAIPLIAGIFQRIYPDAPMYSIGFFFSAVVIYAFNITAQKEADMARLFRQENDKLSAIASGLSDDYRVVYYVDMDTDAYENFGADHQNGNVEKGENFFTDVVAAMARVVHPEDMPTVSRMLSKTYIAEELQERKAFRFNYRVAAGENEYRYYMIKIIRADIEREGNKIIVGVFDDDERVREQMEVQEDLRLAREQAEAASRAKTNFLFNMSHDIRTPMNAILGFTGIAQKSLDDPEKAAECLRKVHSAGDHLLSLINDILDMSRIENNKVVFEEHPLSIRRCGEDILDIVRPLAAEKDITLAVGNYDVTHDGVSGDVMHLSRVFLNILTNAIKYTPAGGKVTCDVNELAAEGEKIRYRVVIRDNGIGMSAEYLTHIYETFSRERNSTLSGVQGTGLGMAITKTLVDMMQGTIGIESEQGKGTTVTIEIPLSPAEAQAEDGEQNEAADLALLQGKTILLVEDNELNREIATDMLSDLGLSVETAEDGTVAVKVCEERLADKEKKFFDYILMDVQMPLMDGYTATGKIREMADPRAKDVPIIAMTANVFAEDIRRALDAGMNAHLGKPINKKELIKALRGKPAVQ